MGDISCPLNASKRRHFEPSNALRYSEPLVWMENRMAVRDPWLQLLGHKLLHCQSAMAHEQLATFFIRRVFMANLKKVPSAKFHLLRLCVQHRLLLPVELLSMAIDALGKCASVEEEDLEEGQLIVASFSGEFGKQKELLFEARQLRKKDKEGEEEEKQEDEAEEGELRGTGRRAFDI